MSRKRHSCLNLTISRSSVIGLLPGGKKKPIELCTWETERRTDELVGDGRVR